MSSPTSFVSPPSSPVPSSITLTNTAVNPIPTTPSDPESAERSLLGEPIPIASPYNNQAVLLQAIVNQMEAEEAEEIANALATHLPSSSSPSLQGLPPSPPARTEPPSPMPELISSRPSSPDTSVASCEAHTMLRPQQDTNDKKWSLTKSKRLSHNTVDIPHDISIGSNTEVTSNSYLWTSQMRRAG